jgi:hypothetical protein
MTNVVVIALARFKEFAREAESSEPAALVLQRVRLILTAQVVVATDSRTAAEHATYVDWASKEQAAPAMHAVLVRSCARAESAPVQHHGVTSHRVLRAHPAARAVVTVPIQLRASAPTLAMELDTSAVEVVRVAATAVADVAIRLAMARVHAVRLFSLVQVRGATAARVARGHFSAVVTDVSSVLWLQRTRGDVVKSHFCILGVETDSTMEQSLRVFRRLLCRRDIRCRGCRARCIHR